MSKRILTVVIVAVAFLCVFAAVSLRTAPPASASPAVIYINNEADWETFIAGSFTTPATGYEDKTIVLNTDLYFYRRNADPVYAGVPNYVFSEFKGTFEGNGHALVGLRYQSIESRALFSYIGTAGEVRNLNIVDIEVSSLTYAAGVAVNNLGKISNVRVQGSLSGASEGGGIAHKNYGAIENCASAVVDNGCLSFGAIVYDNYYSDGQGGSITNTYNITSQPDYILDAGTGVEMPAGTLLDDGYADDYFEIYYLKDPTFMISHPGMIPGSTFSMRHDINLYSQETGWLVIPLSDRYHFYNIANLIILPTPLGAFTVAIETPSVPDTLVLGGTGVEEDPYILFEGAGTEASPYLIGTATDLQRLDYLYAHREDWADFGLDPSDKLYFSLTTDIGLLPAAATYFDIDIQGFDGIFDGNGKSVAGVIDSLFDTIETDGVVKNLSIRGEVRSDGEALVAQENFGTVSGIRASVFFANAAASRGAGLVCFNHLNVLDSSVKVLLAGMGTNAAVVYENTGEYVIVRGTRSASAELPFLYTGKSNSMMGCYQDNAVWFAEDPEVFPIQSVAEYGGVQYFEPDTDPYDLLNTANPLSGWGWTQQGAYGYHWCVLAGGIQDRFVLRMPSDIAAYKTTGRLRFTDNNTNELYLKRTYKPEGQDDINIETFINATIIPPYTWTYTDAGNQVTHHTDNFPKPENGKRIVDVGLYDIYFVTEPTLTETARKAHARIEIEKIRVTYTASDLRVLTEGNYAAIPGIFENYGANERDSILIKEPTKETRYDFDNLGVTVTTNGDAEYYPYSINLTNLFYSGIEIPSQTFMPFCAPSGASVTYTINRFYRPDQQINTESMSIIREAGTYYLDITVSCDNYFDAVIPNVVYRIFRKEVPVTPYINTADGKIPYGEDIAGYVSYTIDTTGFGEVLTLEELAEIGFTTNYTAGAATGIYNLSSVRTRNKSNNYRAVPVTVQFEVVKIDIPGLSALMYAGAEFTYDGLRHEIAVSGLSGDMAVEYIYNSVASDTPPKFINAGSYAVSAQIYMKKPDGSKNTNYNDAPVMYATLSILPKTITVTIRNDTINSGDALPAFELENFVHLLPEREDGGTDIFSAPLFGVNPAYNGTAGTYTIGLTGGLTNSNYNVNVVSGTLTVKRVSRGSFTLINGIKIYDGAFYQPDLGSASGYNAAGIAYYRLDGAVWTPLANAPKDAGSYKLSVPFLETGHYIEETLEATFRIDKATLNPVFTLNGIRSRLASSLTPTAAVYDELIYDGLTYTVQLADLPAGESYLITMFYEKEGTTYQTTSGGISYTNAGYYGNIRAVVSGNLNYEDITLYAGDISYSPRVLRAAGLTPVVYSGNEITLEITVANLSYVLVQDRTSVVVTYTSSPAVIRNAGTYALSISAGNPNYIFMSEEPGGAYTFTVSKYTASVNLNGYRHEVEYGTASNAFYRETTYMVGATQVTETLIYEVDLPVLVTAGIYNVTGIRPTANVQFNLYGGANAYIVTKRTVSFEWGLQSVYEYTGTVRSDIAGYTIPNTSITGRAGNDFVGLTISFNKSTIRDSGSYTATASVSNNNYVLDPACVSFVFTISKAALNIKANDLTVGYGAAPPAYTVTIEGLRGTDNASAVTYQLSCVYAQGNNVGTYVIYVTSFTAANYTADLSASSGVLTVQAIEQTGIVYPNAEAVYNGLPFTYLPQVPEGATASVDVYPLNAGVYTLTATVTRANHLPKTLSAVFTVRPAVPEVVLLPVSVVYAGDGQKVTTAQISGTAQYGETPVAGTFSYVNPNEVLVLGERVYDIVFTPESANFSAIYAGYTVTSALEEPDEILNIVFGAGAENLDGTIYAEGAQMTLFLGVKSAFSEDVEMYVNGVPADNGVFTVTESGPITVEVKKNGILIAEYDYDVRLNTPPPQEENPGDGDNGNGNGNGGGQIDVPKKKEIDWKLFLYVTLGIAGAAGLGFALYFLIRMRR